MSTVYSLPDEKVAFDGYCIYAFSNTAAHDFAQSSSADQGLLEVLLSNLATPDERHLRTFVLKSIIKTGLTAPHVGSSSPIPPEGATISGIAMSGIGQLTSKSLMCFVCVLPDTPSDAISDFPDTRFLVCLVQECDDGEGFELFTPDLTVFARQLQEPLHKRQVDTARSLLSQWWQSTIRDYSASVLTIGQSLPALLHAAVKLSRFSGEGDAVVLDGIMRVAKSAAVVGEVSDRIADGAVRIRVLPTGGVEVSPSVSNAFCREWGNALLLCHGGPVKMRRMMEAYKQKVVLQLNSLQRLFGEAQHDFYALYRTYDELKHSSNRDVLLDLVKQMSTTSFDDIFEVLLPKLEEVDRQSVSSAASAGDILAGLDLGSAFAPSVLSSAQTLHRPRPRVDYSEAPVLPDDGSDVSNSGPVTPMAPARAARALMGMLADVASDNDDLISI
eukprot:TRINITY_DN6127_c0_g1_i1.p1 TRINITY_DN6127_c0_g1~~TRINITY_DN6127_c0_g1_i1.p1  ORF type:complete len:444 (+),score=91.54 TRINITY_DN6127_c0_g1_i1:60-1391(+)